MHICILLYIYTNFIDVIVLWERFGTSAGVTRMVIIGSLVS